MQSITKYALPLLGLAGTLPLISGCSSGRRSPAIDFFGSYFPSWMVCILAGIALTAVARRIFVALEIDRHLRPAPVVYFCLIAVFTFALWIIFFRH